MRKLDTPLLLAPDFKEKIWGREELDPLYPSLDLELGADHTALRALGASKRHELTAPSRIGEAWLTGDGATFLSGPVAGKTLGEVMRDDPPALCGPDTSDSRFPVLAKFLFTSAWLSMQVHPNDKYAALHEKSRGKTEAWYILESDADGEIALGLPAGTGRNAFEAACRGSKTLDLAHRFKPKPLEVVFVPAGTLHALGPGLVLFEISETSDVTYRLDDFGRLDTKGRPRPLHIEQGLATTQLDAAPLGERPRLEVPEPFGRRRYAVACPHFAFEEWAVRDTLTYTPAPARVEGLTIIGGEGRVELAAGWLAYQPGQTWIVPAGASPFRLVPEEKSSLIRFYVPDLDRDFREPLTKRGFAAEVIDEIIFSD